MAGAMINGLHALMYVKDAEKVRSFFRDVLGFQSVEAGEGWLIFQLPPAELGVHPADDVQYHELYFMCDDVKATIDELSAKGVKCSAIREMDWGLLTSIEIPGGGSLGMYQPKHPTALKK
jgi:catechol 2,3-dioxygenase-like lactoylglutathione lyase family enzyme